jgi:hypothetical protein
MRICFRPKTTPVNMVTHRPNPHAKAPLVPSRVLVDDTNRIALARSWAYDSLQRLVIGPVFPPGYTIENVRRAIKEWAADLSFLVPLQDDVPLKAYIDSLRPETDLDRQVVDVLREVVR